MNLEKEYECADCGRLGWPRSMFICPDDRLRCGECVVKREQKAYPKQEERRVVQ